MAAKLGGTALSWYRFGRLQMLAANASSNLFSRRRDNRLFRADAREVRITALFSPATDGLPKRC
jgi:hypothetical protein